MGGPSSLLCRPECDRFILFGASFVFLSARRIIVPSAPQTADRRCRDAIKKERVAEFASYRKAKPMQAVEGWRPCNYSAFATQRLLHRDRSTGPEECAGRDGCRWCHISSRTRRESENR